MKSAWCVTAVLIVTALFAVGCEESDETAPTIEPDAPEVIETETDQPEPEPEPEPVEAEIETEIPEPPGGNDLDALLENTREVSEFICGETPRGELREDYELATNADDEAIVKAHGEGYTDAHRDVAEAACLAGLAGNETP